MLALLPIDLLVLVCCGQVLDTADLRKLALSCRAGRAAADIALSRRPLRLSLRHAIDDILSQPRLLTLRCLSVANFVPIPTLLPPIFPRTLPRLPALDSLEVTRAKMPATPEGWNVLLAALPALRNLKVAFLPAGRAAGPRTAATSSCALLDHLAASTAEDVVVENIHLVGCHRCGVQSRAHDEERRVRRSRP